MTAYTFQTSMNCTQASAKFAEASSCCASTAAYNCMGIILDVIIMASIFVALISVLSLRLLGVAIILVGLVLVIGGNKQTSPMGL